MRYLFIITLSFLALSAQAQQRDSILRRTFIPVISNDHYAKNMGLMCKKELQLEKATKLPLRIRLGSLDHCNYLEGKRRLQ